MNASDPIKQAWQSTGEDSRLPDIEAVRTRADIFYRQIRRRNGIEYVASALVIACFTVFALFIPSPVARFGAALVVLGTVFVVWQLHRRASAIAAPADESATSLVEHSRAQLVRQRDSSAEIGRWYLLPFAPGLALMVFAPAIENGPETLLQLSGPDLASIASIVLVFSGIWWLNQRASRNLQRAIDELDALTCEDD
jgi:hypothetical protein